MVVSSPRGGGGGERRLDESSTNKGPSGDSWRSKPRNDQQNRDDRYDDRRGPPSQNQPASPSAAPERNSETAGNWRTVEKKRPNP
jgi:hypothetical protein